MMEQSPEVSTPLVMRGRTVNFRPANLGLLVKAFSSEVGINSLLLFSGTFAGQGVKPPSGCDIKGATCCAEDVTTEDALLKRLILIFIPAAGAGAGCLLVISTLPSREELTEGV